MATQHNQAHDDTNDFMDFLRNTTRTNNIEAQCRTYLDPETYSPICLDTGDECDVLELYAQAGSFTIQRIVNDYRNLNTIRLQQPAPEILPITISKIANDTDSFIVPSDVLNITPILSRAPLYQLEAVICEINQRSIIFMRNLATNKWYYYQDSYRCEQLHDDLSDKLNTIIESQSASTQRRSINSSHFLLSMIFYNATKYIYKQQDT